MDEIKEEQSANQINDGTSEQTSKSSSIVKHEHKAPVIADNGMSSINLFNPEQLAAAESFLKRIMRSEKGGIKTVEDGFAIMMRAKDLNLPFSTCIEHVHVISGKTGVDIHVIKALLSRAGVIWEHTKDYAPLYEYTDGFNVFLDGSLPDYVHKCRDAKSAKEANEKAASEERDDIYVYPVKWYQDFKGNLYKEYQLSSSRFGIAVTRQQIAEISNSGKIAVYRIPSKPVDFVDEYKFERMVNGRNVIAYGHFSYSEAQQADMFSKDTYAKYPRIMIGHRAFTYGAREIASDILFGVMETTELKVVAGQELNDADIVDIEASEVN